MPWIPLHQTWQIYWQIYPTHQSSMDALNTITPNLAAADLYQQIITPKLGRSTPHQSSMDALNTITQNLADPLADLPHPSINYRCLDTITPKLGRSTPHQSSMDALNTITPNLADLPADLPHPSIKHRCLEYHYTKFSSSSSRSTPTINQA